MNSTYSSFLKCPVKQRNICYVPQMTTLLGIFIKPVAKLSNGSTQFILALV